MREIQLDNLWETKEQVFKEFAYSIDEAQRQCAYNRWKILSNVYRKARQQEWRERNGK